MQSLALPLSPGSYSTLFRDAQRRAAGAALLLLASEGGRARPQLRDFAPPTPTLPSCPPRHAVAQATRRWRGQHCLHGVRAPGAADTGGRKSRLPQAAPARTPDRGGRTGEA